MFDTQLWSFEQRKRGESVNAKLWPVKKRQFRLVWNREAEGAAQQGVEYAVSEKSYLIIF